MYAFLLFVFRTYVVSDEFALRKFPFMSCLSSGCDACQSLKREMNASADPWFGLGGGDEFYYLPSDSDAVKLLLLTSRI